MALRTLSLCAGIGGADLGLRSIGAARTVCYVEREAFAAACLVQAMERGDLDDAPIWSDLRTFDAGVWRGAVDLVVAGYPCQPFSFAGKRAGGLDERHLWPDVLRIWRECGARYLFCENVAGHLSLGFDAVLADLAESGADVEWDLFRASDVGAPHKRERLFFLAHSTHIGHERSRGARHGRPGSANGIDDVANAEGCDGRIQLQQRESREAVPQPRGPGCDVGDADIARLERRGVHGRGRSDQRAAWPPGPSDADAWREWIEHGGPQPAVCRGADGISHRLDRLRALGNAIVPQVAALAWQVLSRRISGGLNPLAPTSQPAEPAVLAGAPPAVMAASANTDPADVVKAGNVPR